jgi:phospholipase C
MRITRRTFVGGMGVAAGAAALGCGSNSGGTADASGGPDGAGADGALPDAAPDASPPDAAVNACTSTSSMTPAELLAHIDTIVVLCMENRSFDHYLGSLRFIEGRTDVDGLTGTETNPSPSGGTVQVHQLDDFTPADPPHGWDAEHEQWNEGAMDGFVASHAGPDEADVMGYHVRVQLPATYALADAGVVCNRWFCSVLGPTWPNRFYLHGATSNGQQGNLPAFGFQSVFSQLDDAGVTNVNYYSDVAWATGGYFKLAGLKTIEQFFEQAEAGTLPQFSIIDPLFFAGNANDDHPDHDITLGQALIASVAAAIGQSPQWERTLFVLTYDENGGFYDHVPPPVATDDEPAFQQQGIRVPSIVIGPTVRRGCAVDTVLEHSSISKTLAVRHGLDPLNARATAANDLSACIDPARIGDPLPPPTIPAVTVSLSRLAAREEAARANPPDSHHELAEALDRMDVPRALDRRAEGDAIGRRILAWGERLGAVKLVP